jgi:hypothetical protein
MLNTQEKEHYELIDLVLVHDPNAPIKLLTDVIGDCSDLFDGEQVGAPDPCRVIVRGGKWSTVAASQLTSKRLPQTGPS